MPSRGGRPEDQHVCLGARGAINRLWTYAESKVPETSGPDVQGPGLGVWARERRVGRGPGEDGARAGEGGKEGEDSVCEPGV